MSRNFEFVDDSVKTEVKQAVLALDEQMSPGLIELADGEAKRLNAMGNRSYAFVMKALEYVRQYPEFAGLIDVSEFEAAVKGHERLREIYIPLTQLQKKFHDTMLLTGSMAVNAALTFYGTAKEGRKRRLPNSILVCDELGKRFPCRAKAPKIEPGEEANV